MKLYVALPLSLMFSTSVWASALASIYNGEQYHLNGSTLVQDSDKPDVFYILPSSYHIKPASRIDQQGNLINDAKIKNNVIQVDGQKYSTYTMTFEMDTPGKLELVRATQALRQQTGRDVTIQGLVPICGLRIAAPGFAETRSDITPEAKLPSGSTLIRYDIRSTDAEKCASILDTSEFNLEYRVPIEQEPTIAEQVMSDVGLVLPPIELILPYKYKDHVKVTVDAESVVKQLKAGGDIAGSFKKVTAQVKASIEQVFNSLAVSGGLQVDCQNPDRKVCDQFIDQAKDILAKTLFIYTSNAKDGDTNPMVLADKDKAVETGGFRAVLGYDQEDAKRQAHFEVDFSNIVYSGITSQLQVKAANMPRKNLAPEISKLLKADQQEADAPINFRMSP